MSSVAAVTGKLSEDGQCDEKESDKKLDAIASGSGSVYLNEKMMDVGEGRIRLLRNVPNPEACQALRGMKDHLDSKELVATAPPGGQMTAVATSRPGSYTKGAMVPEMKMGARVTEEELELLKAAATAKALASGQDA